MSSPYRHQQARISQINGPSRNKSRNKVSHASISVLLKCCKKHPNASRAIFISILFSWVASVALFLSNIQRNDHHSLVTMSPLHARDNHAQQLRVHHASMMNAANEAKAAQEPLSHHDKQHQPIDMSSYGKGSKKIPFSDKRNKESIDVHTKKRITSYLLSKLPGYNPDPNAPILPDEPWNNIHMNTGKHNAKRQNNHGRKHFRDMMFHNHVDAELESEQSSDRKKQHPQGRIAGSPMSKLEQPASKDHHNNAKISFHHSNKKKLKFTKLDNDDSDDDEIESRHQSTHNALATSTLYVQTSTDKSTYNAQVKDAFAPKQYFEKPTIGSDFDTYFSTDDDIARGTGYTQWPNGKEPFCSTPTFYRLYKPTCKELHSVASGYDWLKGDNKSKHHRSRYLGEYKLITNNGCVHFFGFVTSHACETLSQCVYNIIELFYTYLICFSLSQTTCYLPSLSLRMQNGAIAWNQLVLPCSVRYI